MSIEAEQHAWVETWAGRIEETGLSVVALPCLEIAHAFGLLGSQALLMVQPLMTGIVSDRTVDQAVALLENPELLEHLRMCLEGKRG